MKNLIIKTIVFVCWFFKVSAQEPTPPQAEGYGFKSDIEVSIPFSLKGVPFSQIPGSVWEAGKSIVKAQLNMSYQIENDNTQYMSFDLKESSVDENGNWEIKNLSIEPPKERLEFGDLIPEKTEYSLEVWHELNGKKSMIWGARIHKKNLLYLKHLDAKLPPVKVHPKDMHSIEKLKSEKLKKNRLNPQPIPPQEKIK